MIGARLAGSAIDEASYQTCLTQSVAEIVREQAEAGIDSVSDGEFGKIGWSIYVAERLFADNWRPEVGQYVEGSLWMQAHALGRTARAV